MALFMWKCSQCNKIGRGIRPTRPDLELCTCGGIQVFVTKLNTMVMETLDNGLMVKKLERLENVEQLLKDRNDIAEKPDDEII